MPLMLLNASVAKPSPSYLKSYSMVCLPGASASGAFPADPLQVQQVPEKHRLAIQQIHAVSAEPPAVSNDHAVSAALGHVDVRRDRVGGVEHARRRCHAGCR